MSTNTTIFVTVCICTIYTNFIESNNKTCMAKIGYKKSNNIFQTKSLDHPHEIVNVDLVN